MTAVLIALEGNFMYRAVLPLVAFAALVSSAYAQPKPRPTAAEDEVVAHCLGLIRGCQLPDGAIAMTPPTAPDAEVWIAPYFADHAALALLAQNSNASVTAADRRRVGQWLTWCCKHQEKGGYWCDYVGTAARPKSNDKVDAYDSSAALFLLVVERYQRAGGKVTVEMRAAVAAALKCIDAVTDGDGLTWAKPDYRVKYLMDNVEVYAGLSAAAELLAAYDVNGGKAVAAKAAAVARGVVKFWGAVEVHRFAWALHPDGHYDGGLEKMYPRGLAQLFGVTFVAAEASPFGEVVRTFEVEDTPLAAGVERYLMAASRVADKGDTVAWRAKTVAAAARFDSRVYVFRPGLAVLALREGADWMPSPLSRPPK